jgi:nucleotide-binding universal stress UspA family protein
MPMRNLLLATDFSATADLALARALAVARQHRAHLTIAFVETPQDVATFTAEAELAAIEMASLQSEMQAYEERELAIRVARAGAAGVSASGVRKIGEPEETIAELARELEAGLIICGTHGRTGVRRFFLGSVAERLSRLAHKSVLVARGAAGDGRFHKILVATDFAPAASRALEGALRLAAPGADVHVINAWQYPVGSWGLSALGDRSGALNALRGALTSAAAEQGARLEAAQAAAGKPVSFRLVHGSAADVVTETAAAEGFDLVAVGTHGHRGIRRLVLGSVAETIIRHAPCSVLIAHHDDEPMSGPMR